MSLNKPTGTSALQLIYSFHGCQISLDTSFTGWRIIESGSLNQLLDYGGTYAALWRLQTGER